MAVTNSFSDVLLRLTYELKSKVKKGLIVRTGELDLAS